MSEVDQETAFSKPIRTIRFEIEAERLAQFDKQAFRNELCDFVGTLPASTTVELVPDTRLGTNDEPVETIDESADYSGETFVEVNDADGDGPQKILQAIEQAHANAVDVQENLKAFAVRTHAIAARWGTDDQTWELRFHGPQFELRPHIAAKRDRPETPGEEPKTATSDQITSIKFRLAPNTQFSVSHFRDCLESLSGEDLAEANLTQTGDWVQVTHPDLDRLAAIVDHMRELDKEVGTFQKNTGSLEALWFAGKDATKRILKPCLFISYSSEDREDVEALVRRIEQSETANEANLDVWFDRDRGRIPAGSLYEDALAQAVQEKATAFAIFLGTHGIERWARLEAGLAHKRAVKYPEFRIIPILNDRPVEELPDFLQLYQAIRENVLADDKAFAELVTTAIGNVKTSFRLVKEPFVGLRPFDEQRAHLFFGREQEVEQLLTMLRDNRLAMVVGDSGSGKSSLVRAGLIPAFRNGALHGAPRHGDTAWHVITARPRRNPLLELASAVGSAAEATGRDRAVVDSIQDRIITRKPGEDTKAQADRIALCLRDSAPAGSRTKTLLVVDQLEELFTQCPKQDAKSYIDLITCLSGKSGPHELYIVMTMRADYYNLLSQFTEFYGRLEERAGKTNYVVKYVVQRMEDANLRDCVLRPLGLAGRPSEDLLADEVIRDVGTQPGNLALLQMALSEAWNNRHDHSDDLLESYVGVGGLSGALAKVADELYDSLGAGERECRPDNGIDNQPTIRQMCAQRVFLRLAQLGQTGGATRRLASRDEFRDEEWAVVEELASSEKGQSASDETRRLFVMGGDDKAPTAELCHDALITQWPMYQTFLSENATLKRIHDVVISETKKWQKSKHPDDLLKGNRLNDACLLAQEHPDWLSVAEAELVAESRKDIEREADERKAARQRQQRLEEEKREIAERAAAGLKKKNKFLVCASIIAGVLFVAATSFGLYAAGQRDRAQLGFEMALKAAGGLFFDAADSTLMNEPGMQKVQMDLMESSLEFIQGFIKEWGDDPKLQLSVARAKYGLGRYLQLTKANTEALKKHKEAQEILEKLDSNADHDPKKLKELLPYLGDVYNAIANVQAALGDHKAAIGAHGKAIGVRKRLLAIEDRPEHRRRVATAHMNRGKTKEEDGDPNGAQVDYDEAKRILGKVLRGNPDEKWVERELALEGMLWAYRDYATVHYDLGLLDTRLGYDEYDDKRYAPAKEYFEAAIGDSTIATKEFRRIWEADTRNLRSRRHFALALTEMANVQTRVGEILWIEKRPGDSAKILEDAEAACNEALPQFKWLAEHNPDVSEYQTNLANVHKALAGVEYERGHLNGDKTHFEQAIAHNAKAAILFEQLVVERGDEPQPHHDLALVRFDKLYYLKELPAKAAEFDKQRLELRTSIEKLHARFPNSGFDFINEDIEAAFPSGDQNPARLPPSD